MSSPRRDASAGSESAHAAPREDQASAPRAEVGAHRRLRQMVDQHFDFVWRSVRGLGVPSADADDAAQQVFVVASHKLDAIAVGSERGFLFATARGIASNARRAKARRREHTDDRAIEMHLDTAPNPEESTAIGEGKRLLEQLLDQMSEDLRTVFVLFEVEGMTTALIAELLSIPIGTVASRLRRAREVFDREAAAVQAKDGKRDE